MAITPLVLIAVTGLLQGKGLQVSQVLQNLVSEVNNNELLGSYSLLEDDGFDTSGLPDKLRSVLTDSKSQANDTLDQAKQVFGGVVGDSVASMKSFLGNFGGASAFASASAEFSAALNQFQNLSFADMGINVQNYQDLLNNGVSSITTQINDIAQDAASTVTSQLEGSLADLDLVSADVLSDYVSDGLKSVGQGVSNFGSMMDFSDVSALGPANMIRQLQRQGLSQKYGIDEYLTNAGYDPKNVHDIPANVLETTLSFVQGDDMKAIIKATNVTLAKDINNLAEALVVSNILPPQALAAMGLVGNAPAMLQKFGSSLSNLGASLSNANMSEFLQNVETGTMKHLSKLTTVIPQPIPLVLPPFLGSGSGAFGNPTMKDMVGAVAGLGYNEHLVTINDTMNELTSSTEGQALLEANQAYNQAKADSESEWSSLGGFAGTGLTLEEWIADDGNVTIARSAVQAALDALPNAITAGLENAIDQAADGLTTMADNLLTEVQNLATAGIDLIDNLVTGLENLVDGISNVGTAIFAFGNKLHQLGTDKTGVGYAELINQITTDDIYGDAIKACLIEGRNLNRNSSIRKPNVTVADVPKQLSEASNEQLDTLKQAYLDAAAKYDRASQKLFGPEGKTDPNVNRDYELAQSEKQRAEDAMRVAARQADVPESGLPRYKSPYKNFS